MTGTTTFQALKAKNDPLVFAPLNSMILAYPWTAGATYIPSAFVNSSGQLLTWPTGWLTLGEVSKKAGIDMTPDIKTNDIGGLGSLAPRRTVITDRGVNIDFTAQEWRNVNMSMYHGANLTTTTANTTTGDTRGSVLASPLAQNWSLIIMSFDGIPGSEVYPYWIYPKAAVTKVGKQSLNDGQAIEFPETLTIYQDAAYVSADGTVGPLYDFGVVGLGWLALAAQAGFLPTVTGITVIPSAASIAHTADIQLLVHDSNGVDVTDQCTFSSGTPADATVNANTGLVAGVATGSSVITASYTTPAGGGPFTGTTTITLT